jgi:hypothetical protein
MKNRIFTGLAFLCIINCCFTLGSLNGKWTGTLFMPDGETVPISYTFKADSTRLTGYGSSPQGIFAISNGRINGSDFTFTVSYNGANINNKGKFYAAADSVALDIDFSGTHLHSKLTR